MAFRSFSSRKRLRQNVKRAALNKSRKTQIKTRLRAAKDAAQAKDPKAAEQAAREAAKILDRNANRRTIHPNTAARRKSRLMKAVNAMKAAAI